MKWDNRAAIGLRFAREELTMAKLCLLSADGAVAGSWEIGDQPIVVGRGESAYVRIDDDGLSRRHFMIFRDGEDYVIKDLNSRNGTWLDGDRANQTPLWHNDCILAGRTRFRFFVRDSATLSAPKSAGPHDTEVVPFSA